LHELGCNGVGDGDVCLLLAPVVGALGAHEDEVHPVLGRVDEGDGLIVLALAAAHVLLARESGVLNALLVDLEEEGRGVLCTSLTCSGGSLLLAGPVHAVVSLIAGLCAVAMAADPTLVDETGGVVVITESLLLGLEHVVALLAEAHTSECHPCL